MNNLTLLNKNTQQGFTLIELMISLVLGLLISAAAMQIYIINVKTLTFQQSSSDIQDASIFGMQYLESQIRLANLGSPVTSITDETIDGGIVLTGINIKNFKFDQTTGEKISQYEDVGYLTRSEGSEKSGANGWTGISNMNKSSDQLTIQYTNTTGVDRVDCEGNTINQSDTVIERYFLRPLKDDSTGTLKSLALVCDAGRVNRLVDPYDITDFGEKGVELIRGVDQFRVLLGTTTTSGDMMYLPSQTYLDMDSAHPPITSVKIGLIIHGSSSILSSKDQTSFKLFGDTYTLKNDAAFGKKMRTTYESTVMLRNARVMIP